MSSADTLLNQEFGLISDLVRAHARQRPHHPALIDDAQTLDYAQLDRRMDRVAASLQRDGVRAGDVVAILASSSVNYAAAFLGALRAGAAVAPLALSSTRQAIDMMLMDCAAKVLFVDGDGRRALGNEPMLAAVMVVLLESDGWLAPEGSVPAAVEVGPDAPFNVIYSSGTTGTPKGIVQPHRMRWAHVLRGHNFGYGRDAVTICSTPLYSNTTLVSFFPALGGGGTVVLLPKFEVGKFLALSERHRVTHAMLVPVQYQRLMDHPEFDRYDLSSYRVKFCTSAPFSAALKADVLRRWPGGLVEFYGMTEGGGTCMLLAHQFPNKLHTVGQPAAGHDIRLIDEHGREVPVGEVGEVVGRSAAMMQGYFNQPAKTAEAEWYDAEGHRFIRTGDVGRFDADGFLTLLDRRKDMIISGGFNVYPSDLEAVLLQHEAVSDAAVVGVPSRAWGETPVAYVVLKEGRSELSEHIRAWANERLGKTQRLTAVQLVGELPRNAIGKVLKRELREKVSGMMP